VKAHRLVVSFLAALALVSLLSGVDAEDLYIPASAHTGGVGDTQWRTDLEVKARGAEAATFTLDLLPEGLDNSAPASASFSVAAGACLRLEDVLASAFSFTGTAALRLRTGSGMVLVASRTYNDDPDGTYGQYVPAVAAGAAPLASVDYALIQLSRSASPDDGYRTNLGALNLTASHIVVEVDLHSATGDLLGTVPLSLHPYSLEQVTDIFARVTPGDVEDGFALVRSRSTGARFLAYASVVDNRSGDAVFIPAQEEGPSPELERTVVFEAFMRHG